MQCKEKEVILQKSDEFGFGFSIIGGKGSCLPPVICDIIDKSPADLSQQVTYLVEKLSEIFFAAF